MLDVIRRSLLLIGDTRTTIRLSPATVHVLLLLNLIFVTLANLDASAESSKPRALVPFLLNDDDNSNNSMDERLSSVLQIEASGGCRPQLELLFVMDASGSQKDAYESQKQLVLDILRLLPFSGTGIKIGLIQYAGYPTLEYPLTVALNFEAIEKHIRDLDFRAGVTRTGSALRLAEKLLRERSLGNDLSTRARQPKKVLLLMTDGVSFDDPSEVAQRLRSKQVDILVASLSSDPYYPELLGIAGSPDKVFHLTDQENLKKLVSSVVFREAKKQCPIGVLTQSVVSPRKGSYNERSTEPTTTTTTTNMPSSESVKAVGHKKATIVNLITSPTLTTSAVPAVQQLIDGIIQTPPTSDIRKTPLLPVDLHLISIFLGKPRLVTAAGELPETTRTSTTKTTTTQTITTTAAAAFTNSSSVNEEITANLTDYNITDTNTLSVSETPLNGSSSSRAKANNALEPEEDPVVTLTTSITSSQEWISNASVSLGTTSAGFNVTEEIEEGENANSTTITITTTEIIGDVRRRCPVDLLVLMQRSMSAKHEYNVQKSYVKSLVQELSIDDKFSSIDRLNNTDRVALIQFGNSSDQKTEFGFNDYRSKSNIISALDQLTFQRTAPPTAAIGRALDQSQRIFNQRRAHARSVLVLLSDGFSTDDANPIAKSLRNQNVSIFCVALGKSFDRFYLSLISGSSRNVFIQGAADRLRKTLLDSSDSCFTGT